MSDPKTSTFTIHHDRCRPENWTARDVLAFAYFVQTGSLLHAAHLSRLGVQIVMSEHHVPAGGTLEEIGWLIPEQMEVYDDLGEAIDLAGGGEISALSRAYRGPVEHVVRVMICDGDGMVEGNEFEIKPTHEAAAQFLDSLRTPESGSQEPSE